MKPEQLERSLRWAQQVARMEQWGSLVSLRLAQHLARTYALPMMTARAHLAAEPEDAR